jgi:hypothetical protein
LKSNEIPLVEDGKSHQVLVILGEHEDD